MLIWFVELCAVLMFAKFWFGIPFRGNYAAIFVCAFMYMFSSIGLGILMSAIARTPHRALYFTWFCLIFFVLLSGFSMPLENMPQWVQQCTRVNPVRYFMAAARDIFLKASGMRELWREGGAGHIRRVICPRRLKRCVEPVETRQSAQQIFTPFIRVRYTGLLPKLFVSIALCGRSAALSLSKCAASNCGM